jgi:hypothetical protein
MHDEVDGVVVVVVVVVVVTRAVKGYAMAYCAL